MPTNYPNSLDNFTNPTPANNLSDGPVLHSDEHANANDAIEALESWVGVSGSAAPATLEYRVNNRAPLVHASQHQDGGFDPIALDTLAAPTDNTLLNASTGTHGLMAKLSGNPFTYIGGDGLEHDLSFSQEFYLDDALSITGAHSLITTYPTGSLASVSQAIVSSTGTQFAAPFLSAAGIFSFIGAQEVRLIVQANITAGTKITYLYSQILKYSSSGTETLLGSSNLHQITAALAELDLGMGLPATVFDPTERLEVKFFGIAVGAGGTPTATIYYDGNTSSRLEIGAQLVGSLTPYDGTYLRLDAKNGPVVGPLIVENLQTHAAQLLKLSITGGSATRGLVIDAVGPNMDTPLQINDSRDPDIATPTLFINNHYIDNTALVITQTLSGTVNYTGDAFIINRIIGAGNGNYQFPAIKINDQSTRPGAALQYVDGFGRTDVFFGPGSTGVQNHFLDTVIDVATGTKVFAIRMNGGEKVSVGKNGEILANDINLPRNHFFNVAGSPHVHPFNAFQNGHLIGTGTNLNFMGAVSVSGAFINVRAPKVIPFAAPAGIPGVYSAMPAADTQMGAAYTDLVGFTQCQLKAVWGGAAPATASGTYLHIKWSLDGLSWNDLPVYPDTDGHLVWVTSTVQKTGWFDITGVNVLEDVAIALFGTGGNGIANPSYWDILAEFR